MEYIDWLALESLYRFQYLAAYDWELSEFLYPFQLIDALNVRSTLTMDLKAKLLKYLDNFRAR